MKRTYVYKLRPTRVQEVELAETLEACRRLYNYALSERKHAWLVERRLVVFAEQSASLPRLRKTVDRLSRVNAQVLQDVLHRVDRAFHGFFRRRRTGERCGYPRFRGAGWYDSFCYPQWTKGASFRNGRLLLSKIGSLKIHADRSPEGQPKTCTIIRHADGWYACIVCNVEPVPLPATGESVGIDLGIECFATLSTGEQIPNPRFYGRAQRALKKAHRRFSRRQKVSARKCKARILLAKAHLKVRRARADFCHKNAHALVHHYDRIAVEKLNVRCMVKDHRFAKAISDVGWGLFLDILRAKAERAGRVVVEVAPAGTSQNCSACGEMVSKTLSQRWHSCPHCGCELHRDHNAARNILKKGGGTAIGEALALGHVDEPRTPGLVRWECQSGVLADSGS